MGKPRIKLRLAASGKAPAQGRDLNRAHALYAEAVGMTPAEVLRKPYEARDRFKRKQAQAGFAAQMATALNMSAEQLATASKEEIERRVEQMKKDHIERLLGEEHARVGEIIRACEVTGQVQSQLMMRLVRDGIATDRAIEQVYDVAAAQSDGLSINNSHSPEGGHRKAIDHTAIYARQNGRQRAPA